MNLCKFGGHSEVTLHVHKMLSCEIMHCPSNALSFEYQQENPFVVLFTDEKPQHCTILHGCDKNPELSAQEYAGVKAEQVLFTNGSDQGSRGSR